VCTQCGTSSDSVSCPSCSSNVTHSDSAGVAADNSPFAGCLSESRSSVAQPRSPAHLSDAHHSRNSFESLSNAAAGHNVADLRSKPVDVPQSISTTASDSTNTSRSVECFYGSYFLVG